MEEVDIGLFHDLEIVLIKRKQLIGIGRLPQQPQPISVHKCKVRRKKAGLSRDRESQLANKFWPGVILLADDQI